MPEPWITASEGRASDSPTKLTRRPTQTAQRRTASSPRRRVARCAPSPVESKLSDIPHDHDRSPSPVRGMARETATQLGKRTRQSTSRAAKASRDVASDDSDVIILDPPHALAATRLRRASSRPSSPVHGGMTPRRGSTQSGASDGFSLGCATTTHPTLSGSMAKSRPGTALPPKARTSHLPVGVPRPPTKKRASMHRVCEPTPSELLSGEPPPPTQQQVSPRPRTPTQPRASGSSSSRPPQSSKILSSTPVTTTKLFGTSTTPSPSPPRAPYQAPKEEAISSRKRAALPAETAPPLTRVASRGVKRRRPAAADASEPASFPITQNSPPSFKPSHSSSQVSADRSDRQTRRARTSGTPALPPSPTLLAALQSTDFPALDPDSTYGLQTSILFQIEHVKLGPLTYEQGGRRAPGVKGVAGARAGIGARVPPPSLRSADSGPAPVPSWARTVDGREWEDDLLRRLGTRLAAANRTAAVPTASTAASRENAHVDALVPLVFAADVHRLRLARLGSAGGTECYLLGRGYEYPCKTVIMQGWVLDRDYRERDNSHVYTVDDGTGIVAVHCAAPSPHAATGKPSSSSAAYLSTTVAPPRDLHRYAAQLHAERQFAALEQRAERSSEKTVLPVGKVVRVVGTVEEPRNAWDSERRIVATRVELVDDVDQVSLHLLEVARLHREVYGGRFDVAARLAALEAVEEEKERQRQQREWDKGSSVGSASAPNTPSKSRREPIRPTAPARLPTENITLYGFTMYIKLHVERHYLQRVSAPGHDNEATATFPPSSPSPFAASDPPRDGGDTEISIPFSLPQLRANKQLSIYATRLAQEQARVKEQRRVDRLLDERRKGPLALAAATRAGRGGEFDETPVKGQAWTAVNPYLSNDTADPSFERTAGAGPDCAPVSTSATSSSLLGRRARQRRETIMFWEEAGPLYDDELAEQVGKVWRTAIRTMRSQGTIIEYTEPVATEPAESSRASSWRRTNRALNGSGELLDLPRYGGTAASPIGVRTPRKRKAPSGVSNCPWGDVRLQGSDDDDAVSTPRPSKQAKVVAASELVDEAGPAPGCPWGDVKLFGEDNAEADDAEGEGTPVQTPVVATTPQARRPATRFSPEAQPRSPSPELDFQLPPSAQRPPLEARAPHRSPSSLSDSSDASLMTTGSLADDVPAPQRFQLVTAASLCPLVDSLVASIYATNTHLTSVSSEDVRKRLYLDSQWEAVARHGDQVDEALDLLCLDGALQRHGQGFRPTHRC
ncbi:hypothetical protein JCM3774_005908 [Rhodotorula dairenensis]